MRESPPLSVITARTPDPDLIEQIEKMLEHAKSGELVGAVWIAAWHADYASYGLCFTPRADRYKILGTMVLAQNDIAARMNSEN